MEAVNLQGRKKSYKVHYVALVRKGLLRGTTASAFSVGEVELLGAYSSRLS